ncbi:MAG: hypothetical protein K8L91_24665 [Anaerolineae bacterium]|nr:hypothetical protein [Anaerolineae bacterium]
MNPVNLEIQLEACLRRLAKGATLEECLAAYPHNRAALEPLLRAAVELSAAAPASSLPTPDQIARMQTRVLNGVAAQSKITRFPSRMVVRMGLMAAGMMLILSGYVVLAGGQDDPDQHGEAAISTATDAATEIVTSPVPTIVAIAPTQTATDQPLATATLRPSETVSPVPSATASSTTLPSETPPPIVTDTVTVPPQASETPVEVGDATELAVYMDITGSVAQGEQVTVAGVPIVEENAGDFGFASGDVVTVSGLLLDEGQILVETARFATPDEQANAPQCPIETPKCDPVLLVLGDALGIAYTELEALSTTQLGNGEIARIYLLAQAGAGDVASLIAQRTAGASWRDLMPADASPLNNGVNLGNGKGQSIRENDSTPIHPGNSGNAPGQTHRPTKQPSNNGQGNNGNGNNGNNGQGNQGNNGNNGQGNQSNSGNNGNNGQGNQGNNKND